MHSRRAKLTIVRGAWRLSMQNAVTALDCAHRALIVNITELTHAHIREPKMICIADMHEYGILAVRHNITIYVTNMHVSAV